MKFRKYKVGDLVYHDELSKYFAGADIIGIDGFGVDFREDYNGEMPRDYGVVVKVLQRKKDRVGYIEVRWGECRAKDTIYAEYHFQVEEIFPVCFHGAI